MDEFTGGRLLWQNLSSDTEHIGSAMNSTRILTMDTAQTSGHMWEQAVPLLHRDYFHVPQ